MLIDKVKENIVKYNMIESGDTVLIGVSGGYDSIMLLDILVKLKEKMDFKIVIAHINHGVRGDESKQDEKFVELTASRYGIKFFSTSVDMEGYAKKNRITDEEAGRILRYGFFREVLDQLRIEEEDIYINGSKKDYGKNSSNSKAYGQKIAVAHNMNDQAETILMRVMRGTGIEGLRGIEYVNGNIIRPILNITREEIEKYCEEHDLKPRLDSTNLKPIYNRNKVRLELIPYIEENFNENIVETLFRLSENSVKDSEVLRKITEDKYVDIVVSSFKSKVILDNKKFRESDNNLKGRLIRKAILEAVDNLIGIEEKNISQAIALSDSDSTGKSIDIPGGIRVKLEYNKLYIEKSENISKVSYNYMIDINNSLTICETGASMSFQLKNRTSISFEKDKNVEYFDYDEIRSEIFVRNRKNGDRVQLFGMDGQKKLKDFFIDQKIPREVRDRTPLLVFGDEIAWIVGFRRSSLAPITELTEKVLRVQYFQKEI